MLLLKFGLGELNDSLTLPKVMLQTYLYALSRLTQFYALGVLVCANSTK